ncbi:MAG TPA: immunoglobulin domain-containing protein [Candidatus Saccharimonadales bacterium]|nr:immunoglobulin domain-containing protein [Candidatus Saccharimonadales bacterium]
MSAKHIFARRCGYLSVIGFAMLWCGFLEAATVSLAWNPSLSAGVAGYQLNYGLSSGNYTSNVDAGTNTSLQVGGLTPGLTYYFAATAYSSNGISSPFSNEAVESIPMPPAITSGPFGQTAIAGASAVFSVTDSSTAPTILQWYKGAAALAGATNSTLVLASVLDANAGQYRVVISNAGGSVTSSVAGLTIIDPPKITSQPVAQSVLSGATASFQVVATGTQPLLYQWYDGSLLLSGATNTALNLPPVSTANAGSYYVTVQNTAGLVTSINASLSVTKPANPFTPLAGIYNGLFYQTNGNGAAAIAEGTAGMLANCVIAANGTYSAKLFLGGFNYPVTGTLNVAGNDSEVVSRAANNLSNLIVALSLDMTGRTRQITGQISSANANSAWASFILADLATNASQIPSGYFPSDILPLPGSSYNAQLGNGIVVFNIAANGIMNLCGYLADGTYISQAVSLSKDSNFPIYISLYGGLGLFEGWGNIAGRLPTGTITWIRPAGIVTTTSFPLGFTNMVEMQN